MTPLPESPLTSCLNFLLTISRMFGSREKRRFRSSAIPFVGGVTSVCRNRDPYIGTAVPRRSFTPRAARHKSEALKQNHRSKPCRSYCGVFPTLCFQAPVKCCFPPQEQSCNRRIFREDRRRMCAINGVRQARKVQNPLMASRNSGLLR